MIEALGEDGWLHHERESWVRICGTWVPYPFQYNIHRLPAEERTRCFEGLQKLGAARSDEQSSPHSPPFKNFEQLIRASFGEGISEIFMLPYNEKVWAYPPAELATGWTEDRVAMPDLARVAEAMRTNEDHISWGPNNQFRFPKTGGTGAVRSAVAERLPAEKIQYGRRVTAIDPQTRTVTAEDGTQATYESLITSIPLDVLCTLVGSGELNEAAARGLRYSSVNLIGVGLLGKPGPDVDKKCWMYFPEANAPFYRVTVFSHYSPNNVPDIGKYWSLMAEVSESPHKPVDEARVAEDTVEGMLATGLIENREQVNHTYTLRIERGYPTPSLRRDEAIEFILPRLEEFDIYSRGRFGAWKYEVSNQDHSMMQGVEVVNRLVHGSPELTLWFPNIVNRMHPIYGKAWL